MIHAERPFLAVLSTLTTLTLVGAAGCAVGPDYARPEVAKPSSLAGSSAIASDAAAIRFTTEAPTERWWEVFKDPTLDRLVASARENNPGLLASLARVEAARAITRQAFSPLLPSIENNGKYAYARQSKRAFGLKNVPSTRTFEGTDTFQQTTDMSYEVDLWGRIRRSVEAADAQLVSTDEDRKNVEITLVADVVQTYFDLGAAEARLTIARDTVAAREKTLAIVKGRRKLGLATQLDEARAEGELAAAGVDIPDAERERAVAEHRLAILLGKTPDVSFAGKAPASFELPPEVPVGLPSTLLERRPDVKRAEANLVAANARIGVAKAEYFPKVTIVGRVGYSALDAGKMLNPAAQLWSVGPQVSVPIFEGGRIQASVFEAEARSGEAESLYREAVLKAFGEVADSIFAIGARRNMREREETAVAAQERAAALAEAQFKAGLVDYLTVLDAQRSLFASQSGLLRSQRELLGELVRLQKALGGGWTVATTE